MTTLCMKSTTSRLNTVLLILSLACPSVALPLDITVMGSWNKSIDKNDLVSGAGSDLLGTHNSNSNQVTIDVYGTTGGGDNWRLDVNLTGNTCNPSLGFLVRRTSSGTGGSVSGGLDFQLLTAQDAPLFTGAGDVSGIEIQLQLTGASVQIPASSCNSSIYYTVVDTL